MPGTTPVTPQQLQARLDLYLAAEAKILLKQEYTIDDGGTSRRLRYADLTEVRAEIENLRKLIASAQAFASGGRRVYRIVPG